MLVVPDQGEQILLEAAIGKTPATAWTLRLFVTSHTPAHDDTEADYTEAAGGGYAGLPLIAANWLTTPGAPTLSAYPLQTFTFSGPLTGHATVYGYYVTNAAGRLLFAERFAQPFTPAHTGDYIQITPQITLASVSAD